MANIATAGQESLSIFNDPKLGSQFTSFSPDTMEGKIKLYNAINSPDCRLADFINTPIAIKDVVITRVELSDKVDPNEEDWARDRTTRQGMRVIVIDGEDKSYTATSSGIYNSICTLRAVFGTLHFEEPLKAVVKQIKTKNGNTLTLSLKD